MKVLVIGDSIVDHYVYGNIRRQSPEDSTIPVLDLVDQEYRLGGACNVATNIKSLSRRGTEVYITSIFSDFTVKMLKEKKVSYDEKVLSVKEDKIPHPRELIKTRYIHSDSGKQLLRVDNRSSFSEEDIQRYKNKCYFSNFINFDIIVVSDYDKGIIDQEIINKLKTTTSKIFVDTKKKDLSIWKDIPNCYIKINKKEFDESKNANLCRNVIVTLGDSGCQYYEDGNLAYTIVTEKVEKCNVIGAGDVFLAGLVVASAEKKAIEYTLKFANKAAGISVSKFGTCEVERSEL